MSSQTGEHGKSVSKELYREILYDVLSRWEHRDELWRRVGVAIASSLPSCAGVVLMSVADLTHTLMGREGYDV
eukprot:5067934-Prymnesium_polylepis.1